MLGPPQDWRWVYQPGLAVRNPSKTMLMSTGGAPGPRALWEYFSEHIYHHPPWDQPGGRFHTLTQIGFFIPLVSCWAHMDTELLFPSTLIAKTQSGSAWTPVPLSRPPPQACGSHTFTPINAHNQMNRDSWEVIMNITPPKTLNWCFWIVMLEKTLESPLNSKKIKPVNPKGKWALNIHCKDWCCSWSSSTLATWYKEPTYWKTPWCWERLKAGGEGNSRRWSG